MATLILISFLTRNGRSEIIKFAVYGHVQVLRDGDQVRLVLCVHETVSDEEIQDDGSAGRLGKNSKYI